MDTLASRQQNPKKYNLIIKISHAERPLPGARSCQFKMGKCVKIWTKSPAEMR